MSTLLGISPSAARRAGDRDRFEFGENWRGFLSVLDEPRIENAEASMRALLGLESLEGRSFLDAGCGSGLFSLVAHRLGAETIRSLDFDPQSVACAAELRTRFAGDAPSWSVFAGDLLDSGFVDGLEPADVVYCWGVIHHTGAMWRAAESLCRLVRPAGALVVSVYNDQGRTSRIWKRVKLLYNRAPAWARPGLIVIAILPRELRVAALSLLTGDLPAYLRSWREPGVRGMSKRYDIVDWVGGYPFEVAKPEQVIEFFDRRGFALERLRTVGGSAGCNEFVFRRSESAGS